MLWGDINKKEVLTTEMKCDQRGWCRSETTLRRHSHRYRMGTGGCCGVRVPRGSAGQY